MATNNTMIRNDFNFEAYNAVMKPANAGLKLFLVTQLMSDVVGSAIKYKSPLMHDLIKLSEELDDIRARYKEVAMKAQRQQPPIDTTPSPTAPVADANQFEPAIY